MELNPMTLEEAVDFMTSRISTPGGYDMLRSVLRQFALSQVTEALEKVEVEIDVVSEKALNERTDHQRAYQAGYDWSSRRWRSKKAAVLEEKQRELS